MRRERAGRRPRMRRGAPPREPRRTRLREATREAPKDLRDSIESTQRGLAALLESLERSGFKDAIGPYDEMRVVLIQQRLWSRNNDRADLDPLWSELAATARAIHAILAEFSAVMEDLAMIDRIEPADALGPPGPEAVELAGLLAEGAAVSGSALRRRLPLSDDARRTWLARLVATGLLERRGWGRGISYRLPEGIRGQLADQLAAALRASDGAGQP